MLKVLDENLEELTLSNITKIELVSPNARHRIIIECSDDRVGVFIDETAALTVNDKGKGLLKTVEVEFPK